MTADLANCANCDAALSGAFCAACGQKAGALNPSLGEFLHELSQELLNVDGKTVQSIRLLLTRPGFLSREHFAGRRARYVSPIRLYLVFSVLYFAVAAFAPTTNVRVGFTPDPKDTPEEARMGRERAEAAQHGVNEAITHWAPRAMFLLVPAFASLVAIAARTSARSYPQHLYFALHVHAVWFFAAAISAFGRTVAPASVSPVISLAAAAYAIVYFVVAFRAALGSTISGAIARTAAISVTYAIVVLVSLMAIAFPIVWRLFSTRS